MERANSSHELEAKVNSFLSMFNVLCERIGLKAVMDKIDAVLFGKYSNLHWKLVFRVGPDRVNISNSMEYLGVVIVSN